MGGEESRDSRKDRDTPYEEGVRVVHRTRATGSQVYLYKQDPSVSSIGTRLKWFPEEILPGPSTEDVQICGMPAVQPTDGNNNYLYNPDSSPMEFDSIHTLTVVTAVVRMYRQLLEALQSRPLSWQWGYSPLRVYPHMGEAINAAYSRDRRALCFYYFKSKHTGETVYTTRSFDIVAHETGHAVLDGIKPDWNTSSSPYTNALHESFGDLTAIFGILDDFEMCETIIAFSKGDLHTRSFLDSVAEQFGTAIGLSIGLRNADVDFSLDQVNTECHELSQVFTSAVYDILADIYNINESPGKVNPAMTLYTVAKRLLATLLRAIIKAPEHDATFYDVAHLMIKYESSHTIKQIMKDQFGRRGILDKQTISKHSARTFSAGSTGPGTVCSYLHLSHKDENNIDQNNHSELRNSKRDKHKRQP